MLFDRISGTRSEQMPAVTLLNPFVDVHTLDDRGCAFLGADEIEREKAKQADEDSPGEESHRTVIVTGRTAVVS